MTIQPDHQLTINPTVPALTFALNEQRSVTGET